MLFPEHDIPIFELPKIAKYGDLFELNEHRLLCGDSLNAADSKRLMNGQPYHLCVTDPPYGVNYDPSWRLNIDNIHKVNGKKLQNDDDMDWLNFVQIFNPNVLYIWCASIMVHKIVPFLEKQNYTLLYVIVWNKDQSPISRGDYHYKNEFLLYLVKKGKKHNWQGKRDQHTVWDIQTLRVNNSAFKTANNERKYDHSTQKPIECMRRPMENNSAKGEIVLEPFMGSGTSLIAAELINRISYGCEINPDYVDQAIFRFVKLKKDLNQPYVIKQNGVELNI